MSLQISECPPSSSLLEAFTSLLTKVCPLWLLFLMVGKVMTFLCESCAPSVALRTLHYYCGGTLNNFSFPQLSDCVTFLFSDHTESLPFWLPFSFGVCAFPPATSTHSFHIPCFRIMWCWNCNDSESLWVAGMAAELSTMGEGQRAQARRDAELWGWDTAWQPYRPPGQLWNFWLWFFRFWLSTFSLSRFLTFFCSHRQKKKDFFFNLREKTTTTKNPTKDKRR